MTVPPFNFSQPLVDGDGHALKPFRDWITAVTTQHNATATLAGNAVPNTRRIVASGGLKVGGALTQDVGVALYRVQASVANLPTTGNAIGDWAYALDGRRTGQGAGAGTGVPVFWIGTNHWIAADSGAVVAA